MLRSRPSGPSASRPHVGYATSATSAPPRTPCRWPPRPGRCPAAAAAGTGRATPWSRRSGSTAPADDGRTRAQRRAPDGVRSGGDQPTGQGIPWSVRSMVRVCEDCPLAILRRCRRIPSSCSRSSRRPRAAATCCRSSSMRTTSPTSGWHSWRSGCASPRPRSSRPPPTRVAAIGTGSGRWSRSCRSRVIHRWGPRSRWRCTVARPRPPTCSRQAQASSALDVTIAGDRRSGHAALHQPPLQLGPVVDASGLLRAFGLDPADAHAEPARPGASRPGCRRS